MVLLFLDGQMVLLFLDGLEHKNLIRAKDKVFGQGKTELHQ